MLLLEWADELLSKQWDGWVMDQMVGEYPMNTAQTVKTTRAPVSIFTKSEINVLDHAMHCNGQSHCSKKLKRLKTLEGEFIQFNLRSFHWI